MRRMFEINGIPAAGPAPAKPGEVLGDVRVRVDFKALALALGPKAMKARSFRVELYDGAVTVEAFNIRRAADDANG